MTGAWCGCLCAGLVLLYIGAAVLVARLSSEATMMYYERHIIYGKRFDRHAPPTYSPETPPPPCTFLQEI